MLAGEQRGAWATIPDAAKIIGRGRRTLYLWVQQDRLKSSNGLVWMPDVEELDSVMRRRWGKHRLKDQARPS